MFFVWEKSFLIKYDRSEGPVIVKQFPTDGEEIEDLQSLLACSFPESSVLRDSVYSFSISNALCYVWNFYNSDSIYSIVITSRSCFSFFFLEFFKTCRICLSHLDTDEKFNKVNELLGKWDFDKKQKKLHVFYPEKDFIEDIGSNKVFFQQFDPSAFISPNNRVIEDIFKTIITGKNVLIFGETAEMVSSAGFALMSLFEPMKFKEKYLLFTRLGDQRFADVINGSTEWKFVCTTNKLALERCKQFNYVIEIPQRSNPINYEVKTSITKRFSRLLKKFSILMDRSLEIDPYFDILLKDFSKTQLQSIVTSFDFKTKDLEEFVKLESFREWRRSLTDRSQLREALLSNTPSVVVENNADEDLEIVKDFFNESLSVNDDKHLKAVIANHIKLIKNILEKKKLSKE